MWDVVDIKDGKALLVSSFILDSADLDENDTNDWEKSLIRKWPNGSFIDIAFNSSEEIDMIIDSNVVTNGKYTSDKIFLLLSDEVKKYYSRYEDKNCMNLKLATMATNYARNKGIEVTKKNNTSYYGNSPFWLRDKGDKEKMVKVVDVYGEVYDDGEKVKPDDYYGIRPAMWINLQ